MRSLRAVPYALLFCFLTIVEGTVAFFGGLTWRLTISWFTYYHPLSQMAWWWARQVNDWCFRPLNFLWEFDAPKNFINDRRLKIVVFRHPTTILTWAVAYITGLFISRRIAFVLKGSHIINPMGWGLFGLGLAIFAVRFHEWNLWNRWPEVQRQLHRFAFWWFKWQLARVMRRAQRTPGGIAFAILPDSRHTTERFLAAMMKFGGIIPDLAEWEEQLPPSYLGLLEILSHTGGLDVGVFWVNVRLKQPGGEGWFNFAPYVGGVARARVFEITEALQCEAPAGDLSRFGENPHALSRWLNAFYGNENRADREWRRS